MTWFESWDSVGRTAATGVIAYAALVSFLRLSGKRTLSKLSAFDLVVTVALGSTLATVILSRDVALVDGLLALALLIGLQYGVAWLNVRAAAFGRLVKNEPTMLLYEGVFLDRAMRRPGLRGAGVWPRFSPRACRTWGPFGGLVLETDGGISVVPGRGPRPVDWAVAPVPGPPESAA